jgi:hypothetical protein
MPYDIAEPTKVKWAFSASCKKAVSKYTEIDAKAILVTNLGENLG